jgi:hypothetical protein
MYKKIVMLLLLSGQIGCSTNAVDHSKRNDLIAGLASAFFLTICQKSLISEIVRLNEAENNFCSGIACAGSLLASVPLLFPQASNKVKVSFYFAGNFCIFSNLGLALCLRDGREKRPGRSIISIVPVRKSFRKAELDADACFLCLKTLSELKSEGLRVGYQSECCGNFVCGANVVEYVHHWNKAEHLNNESPSCPMCKEYPWQLQPFDLEKNERLKTRQGIMLLEKK